MLTFQNPYAKLIAISFTLSLSLACRGSDQSVSANKSMTNNSQNSAVTSDPLSIHRRAIIVDMHADTTQRLVDENAYLQKRLADGHLDAVRAQQGGLEGQFFSIWVDPDLFGGGGATAMKRADVQIEAVRNLAASHPETWELAKTADDVRRISESGKIAALM